jgi:hypothetical protein
LQFKLPVATLGLAVNFKETDEHFPYNICNYFLKEVMDIWQKPREAAGNLSLLL